MATDALRLAHLHGAAAEELPELTETRVQRPVAVYPKRSELRRAEGRSGARRPRRDPETRAIAKPSPHRDEAPETRAIGGLLGHAVEESPETRAIGILGNPYDAALETRALRLPVEVPAESVAEGQQPYALRPSAAVLPLPGGVETHPTGLRMAPRHGPNAFRPAPSEQTVPIAVPAPAREAHYDLDEAPETRALDVPGWGEGLAADGVQAPAPAPAGLAAHDYGNPYYDPQGDVPGGLAAQPMRAPGRARQSGRPRTAQDRKKIGAARLLVLAMVVSAEGVALTSMGGTPHFGGKTSSELTGSLSASAVLADSAQREDAQLAAQQQASQVASLQLASGDSKVNAALAQAEAAAERIRLAEERRERALRDAQRNPKGIAKLLAADRGWGTSQFSCLDKLWTRESQWNYRAYNPSSGAYGIPQALPGSKMGSVASDWKTNPVTQIKWGLSYIADRYGTPCGAWAHSESVGWY
ncbi:hypothetical protein ACIB24_16050 [Spongisporangium articulatum]|uniref:Lytic transglycosylase domain-containing protein n=1 Tax=Spongisporangium articulatum TaxID=3362603 RepID=A0ABW8AQD8_9ACTN